MFESVTAKKYRALRSPKVEVWTFRDSPCKESGTHMPHLKRSSSCKAEPIRLTRLLLSESEDQQMLYKDLCG